MKHQPKRPSLLELAIARKRVYDEWTAANTSARIQAIMGENPDQFVDQAGKVFYVVLGAAIAMELDPDMVQLRIIRGAVNSLVDLAGMPTLPDTHRHSIEAGLRACDELVEAMPNIEIQKAALVLATTLKKGDVWSTDFEQLLRGLKT
jgi:hypothetical protein